MITDNRLSHIIAVARLMKEKSKLLGKNNDYANEMFTLGLLHDIGYEFDEKNHNIIGAKTLSQTKYKYSKEIYYHGNPKSKYFSEELDLLNWADMHIDGNGNYVTFEERLKDIATRYGVENSIYLNAKKMVNYLRKKYNEN